MFILEKSKIFDAIKKEKPFRIFANMLKHLKKKF